MCDFSGLDLKTLGCTHHTPIVFQGPTTPIRVLNDFQVSQTSVNQNHFSSVKLFRTIPLVCLISLTIDCFSYEADNEGTSFLFPLPPSPPSPLSSLFLFSHMLRVALHHLNAWDRLDQKQQKIVTCFQPPA